MIKEIRPSVIITIIIIIIIIIDRSLNVVASLHHCLL